MPLTVVQRATLLPALADAVAASQAADVELKEDADCDVGREVAKLVSVSKRRDKFVC